MALPRSAAEHLAKLKLDPELRELAERLFPDEERDRRAREVQEAERTARAQQEQRSREQLCQRCLDGDFGKEAAAAARVVLDESGGAFTAMACNRIAAVIREAQRRAKATRKPA